MRVRDGGDHLKLFAEAVKHILAVLVDFFGGRRGTVHGQHSPSRLKLSGLHGASAGDSSANFLSYALSVSLCNAAFALSAAAWLSGSSIIVIGQNSC